MSSGLWCDDGPAVSRPSNSFPESGTSWSFERWLEAEGIDHRTSAEGADLAVEGQGRVGRVRLQALCPFRVDPGVQGVCAPALVRAEIGPVAGAPAAWAPRRIASSALALYGAGEGWVAAVLHVPQLPPGAEKNPVIVTTPEPHVDRFLACLSDLAGAEAAERRAMLFRWSRSAADALVAGRGGAMGFAARTADMALWAGGGAVAGGLIAATLLSLATPFVPVVAAAGAASSIALRLAAAHRAARIRLWPVTRQVYDAVRSCAHFERTTLSAERDAGWHTLVLTDGEPRDTVTSSLRADNRVEASTPGGAVRLVADTFAFLSPEGAAPAAALVPDVWTTVEVRFAERPPREAIGRLAPLGDGSLVCWLSGREVGGGAFGDEVIEPLERHLRSGATGPYR